MDAAVQVLVPDAARGVIDSLLHVGDVAYDLCEQNGARGDAFMNAVQPLAAQLPHMTSPGNHEEAQYALCLLLCCLGFVFGVLCLVFAEC